MMVFIQNFRGILLTVRLNSKRSMLFLKSRVRTPVAAMRVSAAIVFTIRLDDVSRISWSAPWDERWDWTTWRWTRTRWTRRRHWTIWASCITCRTNWSKLLACDRSPGCWVKSLRVKFLPSRSPSRVCAWQTLPVRNATLFDCRLFERRTPYSSQRVLEVFGNTLGSFDREFSAKRGSFFVSHQQRPNKALFFATGTPSRSFIARWRRARSWWDEVTWTSLRATTTSLLSTTKRSSSLKQLTACAQHWILGIVEWRTLHLVPKSWHEFKFLRLLTEKSFSKRMTPGFWCPWNTQQCCSRRRKTWPSQSHFTGKSSNS